MALFERPALGESTEELKKKIEELEAAKEKALRDLKDAHSAEIRTLNDKHREEMIELKDKHREEMIKLKDERREDVIRLEDELRAARRRAEDAELKVERLQDDPDGGDGYEGSSRERNPSGKCRNRKALAKAMAGLAKRYVDSDDWGRVREDLTSKIKNVLDNLPKDTLEF